MFAAAPAAAQRYSDATHIMPARYYFWRQLMWTGLAVPVMIDATYEYQPLSDLASWPNPFTLVNNLAAGLGPTYMLRGLSLGNLADQILGQVGDLVKQSVAGGKPLSLNVYLTLHSATLPMLEPL